MHEAATQATNPTRAHPRVDANFMVKLFIDGRAIVAKARDLSMNGLFVIGDPIGGLTRLNVCVPLPFDREFTRTCRVSRRTEDGVALTFEELDWDDVFALARFLHPRLP